MKQFSEAEFAEWLQEAIDTYQQDNEDETVRRTHTFEEQGVLTMDTGLVLNLKNGQQVYLTIQIQ